MKGERINFGRLKEVLPIPDLISLQTKSYADFLQKDVAPEKRENKGLQMVLADTFPPSSPENKNACGIEFVKYDIRENDNDLSELLKSGGTYQGELFVTFRMKGASAKNVVSEDIRMGHLPLMTPSGSFIINGSERVIVSQLHRSPGVCFETNRHPSGKQIYSYKILPDHGSWLEVQFDIKDMMYIYLDRKRRRRKFLVSVFLRAFGYNSNREILDAVYGVKELNVAAIKKEQEPSHYTTVEDVVDPKDKDLVLVNALEPLNPSVLDVLASAGIKKLSVIDTNELGDYFIKCLQSDDTITCEDAQKEIYKRMRPSDPANAQNAKALFEKMFQDDRRYDLGLVGRYKLNQLLNITEAQVASNVCIQTKWDIASATRELMRLYKNNGRQDDIDHLSRRRIRTIGELLMNQCRVGLNRVANVARDRMTNKGRGEGEVVKISSLINVKAFENVVIDFFQHNQLSQFMDQTNCLSELTNKRRLSALGPGGLTRDRAGAEVRDVHASHYGRICPIETPEGPNIGLISSLALYAQLDDFGFICTPYCRVKDGKVVTKKNGEAEIVYMKADEEEQHIIAQANAPRNDKGEFLNEYVLGRKGGEAGEFPAKEVEYIDVSPKQMISAAASVITFLEHDDANRALMGCNMQRQAVPLMKPEAPLVGTGMEGVIARYSHAIQVATRPGVVAWADGFKVIVTPDGQFPKGKAAEDYTQNLDTDEIQVYMLYKFLRSNACTLVNQRPIVVAGQKVEKDQPLADGACTDGGELALGRNVLVAFMSWRGYNYEDAIIISEKLVQDDVYTSVHINLQEIEARATKQSAQPEEITRDIPNVSQESLSNLDTEGVIRMGAVVKPGDVLVGKVSPKQETDLAPEERLLKAIFGEKSTDVKDSSLKAEPGNDGVVMDLRLKRNQDPSKVKMNAAELKASQNETRKKYKDKYNAIIEELVKDLSDMYLGAKLPVEIRAQGVDGEPDEVIVKAEQKITKQMLNNLAHSYERFQMHDCEEKTRIEEIFKGYRSKLRENERCCEEAVELLRQNEGAEPGKITNVKVYIASKRRLSIGDKMAGRHGNKGIVSKIVPVADLPFMADGTPVEIVLNPMGVPSRMNIGQVFETHAGYAAKVLGITVATPAFDGMPEERMFDLLERARLVKIAEAAGVKAGDSVMEALREVEGKNVEDAKLELRKLISEAGWSVGERDDVACTGGRVVDNYGIDRTDDFVDIDGKIRLYDGRTGDAFEQRVMVGQIYMLKLDHLVVNKIHARSTGPYSLVTQQPLGGKAQGGGQRFGEMEVWALEAYGAAYTLQEMLTVKSDDLTGRTKIYDSIMKGNNELEAGIPESFNVLQRELMSLCLDIRINKPNSDMA
ncbi:MAG: DNA-directed RNA polymerase subunit beta [Lentisphaeria bacterium]|nr:DNA-directed RNA polymerase subunit beta [Lentisphaeria bacterium]